MKQKMPVQHKFFSESGRSFEPENAGCRDFGGSLHFQQFDSNVGEDVGFIVNQRKKGFNSNQNPIYVPLHQRHCEIDVMAEANETYKQACYQISPLNSAFSNSSCQMLKHNRMAVPREKDMLCTVNKDLISKGDSQIQLLKHDYSNLKQKNVHLVDKPASSYEHNPEPLQLRNCEYECVKDSKYFSFSNVDGVSERNSNLKRTVENRFVTRPALAARACKFLAMENKITDTNNSNEVWNNPAPLFENEGVFHRRFRDSTSSDPEVYTKMGASSEKLNKQFKKLKEEFLALRSSTAAFQQLMDKVLQDLKWIRLTQEQKNFYWTKDNFTSEVPKPLDVNENEQFPLSYYSETQPMMLPVESWNVVADTVQEPPFHFASNVETIPSINQPPQRVTNKHAIFCNITSENSNDLNAPAIELESGNSNLPHLSRDSVNHKIGTESKRNRQTAAKEQLSVPAVFKGGKMKLHVSECSIDSGYQDVLSPPEKLLRTAGSIPIHISDDESEKSLGSHETIPKELICPPPNSAIPNVYVIHTTSKTNVLTSPSDTQASITANPLVYENTNFHSTDQTSAIFHENSRSFKHEYTKLSCQDSFHGFPNYVNCNTGTNECNLSEKQLLCREENRFADPAMIRPIPKQRTMLPSEKSKLDYVERAKKKLELTRKKPSSTGQQKVSSGKDEAKNEVFETVSTNSSFYYVSGLQTTNTSAFTRVSTQPDYLVPLRQGGLDDVSFPGLDSASHGFVKMRKRSFQDQKKTVPETNRVTHKETLSEDSGDDVSMVRRHSMRMMQELKIFNFDDQEHSEKMTWDSKEQSFSEAGVSDLLDTESDCANLEAVNPSYAVSTPFAKTCRNKFGKKAAPQKPIVDKSSMISSEKFNLSVGKSANDQFEASKLTCRDSQNSLDLISDFTFEDSKSIHAFRDFSYSEKVTPPTKFAVFVPALICPKPSLLGNKGNQIETQKRGCNSLKLHPNSKSAFRPVTPTSISGSYRHQTLNSKLLESNKAKTSVEIKRQISLPCMSNKQRFLKEFNFNSSIDERRSDKHASGGFGEFQMRSYPSEDIVESVISTETARVTSYYGLSETPPKFVPVHQRVPEAYGSEARKPHQSNGSSHRRIKTSSKSHSSLSDQSHHHSKKESAKSRRLEKRTDRTTETPQSLQNENKTTLPWIPASVKQRTGDTPRSASVKRTKKRNEPDVSSPHLYETVKLTSNSKRNEFEGTNENQVRNKNYVNLQSSKSDYASPPKSHSKSTVALIKASLFGKLGKSTRSSNHHHREMDESHADRTCISSPSVQTPPRKRLFSKEKKLKKSKSETKPPKRSLVRRFSKERSKHSSAVLQNSLSPAAPLPGPSGSENGRYGHADAEVMERFLEATVAFHSNPPQSPLQRLRSSLRVTRNKHRHLYENGVKDDINVRGTQQSNNVQQSKSTKVHNGQECTYV